MLVAGKEKLRILPVELQEIIKKFVLVVRKKNSKEYERSIVPRVVDRHLRKISYGFYLTKRGYLSSLGLTTRNFAKCKILKKKQKQLNC